MLEFFQVFDVAWEKSMTPKAIKAGFKHTGIWPVNRQAIPDYVREPSKLESEFNNGVCCHWYCPLKVYLFSFYYSSTMK